MTEFERALAHISPRVATVTLLLFDRVVARYEVERGRHLTDEEKGTIVSVLRYLARRDCHV